MRTLLLPDLGKEVYLTDSLIKYTSLPSIGEIAFAFNGIDLIAWVKVHSIDSIEQKIFYTVIDYQYDYE